MAGFRTGRRLRGPCTVAGLESRGPRRPCSFFFKNGCLSSRWAGVPFAGTCNKLDNRSAMFVYPYVRAVALRVCPMTPSADSPSPPASFHDHSPVSLRPVRLGPRSGRATETGTPLEATSLPSRGCPSSSASWQPQKLRKLRTQYHRHLPFVPGTWIFPDPLRSRSGPVHKRLRISFPARGTVPRHRAEKRKERVTRHHRRARSVTTTTTTTTAATATTTTTTTATFTTIARLVSTRSTRWDRGLGPRLVHGGAQGRLDDAASRGVCEDEDRRRRCTTCGRRSNNCPPCIAVEGSPTTWLVPGVAGVQLPMQRRRAQRRPASWGACVLSSSLRAAKLSLLSLPGTRPTCPARGPLCPPPAAASTLSPTDARHPFPPTLLTSPFRFCTVPPADGRAVPRSSPPRSATHHQWGAAERGRKRGRTVNRQEKPLATSMWLLPIDFVRVRGRSNTCYRVRWKGAARAGATQTEREEEERHWGSRPTDGEGRFAGGGGREASGATERGLARTAGERESERVERKGRERLEGRRPGAGEGRARRR